MIKNNLYITLLINRSIQESNPYYLSKLMLVNYYLLNHE